MPTETFKTVRDLYDKHGVSLYIPSLLSAKPSIGSHSFRRLQLGTLDDLALIDNPDLPENFPQREKRKRLDKFIRLQWGPNNTSVYVVDYHQFALYGWCESYLEGRTKLGAGLKHYDEHPDTNPASLEVMSQETFRKKEWSLNQIVEYIRVLGCWEFIEPAQRMGLIHLYKHITGVTPYHRINLYTETVPFPTAPDSNIVDIELDIFRSINSGAEEKRAIRIMQDDIASTNVATLATGPGFIEPERAIELAKKILA